MAIFKDVGSGNGFKDAMRYVLAPKPSEGERVGFAYVRNMGSMDTADKPEALAARMRLNVETHRNNGHRSQKPLHHFVIAFSPEDSGKLTPEIMQEYADRHLEELGLSEHQAVIAQHTDTDHDHLHVIVNKVHPETGKLWNSSHASRKVTELTDSLDAKHGLTPPETRAYSQDAPHRTAYEKGADELAKRTDKPRPMSDKAASLVRQTAANDFREAATWADLENRLQGKGLELAAHTYRGKLALRVVDTERGEYVAASKLGKDIRVSGLEDRLGRFQDYEAQKLGQTAENAPEAAQTATGAQFDRAARLEAYAAAVQAGNAYSKAELAHERTRRSVATAEDERLDIQKELAQVASMASEAEQATRADLDQIFKPQEAQAYFAEFKTALDAYRATADKAQRPDFSAADAAALARSRGFLNKKRRRQLEKLQKTRAKWLAAIEKEKDWQQAAAMNKAKRAELYAQENKQSLQLNPYRKKRLQEHREATGLLVSFDDLKHLPKAQREGAKRALLQDEYNRRTDTKRQGADWTTKEQPTADRELAARADYDAFLEATDLTETQVSFDDYREKARASAKENAQTTTRSQSQGRGR